MFKMLMDNLSIVIRTTEKEQKKTQTDCDVPPTHHKLVDQLKLL